MSDLTVWAVCVGDKYNKGYVYALKEQVEKNLSVPHTFKCITTENLPGIQTRKPHAPYQGWWSKLNLFAPRTAEGPSLYFDLDVVITGSLDYLVPYTEYQFAAPANWAQSGHGGIQSSVMAWQGNWHEPFEIFKPQWPEIQKRLWGDQEFLWEMLGDNWERIPHIGSYKYHVRPTGEIPDWMNVCVFHGKPDPHEVHDQCLQPYTSTLHSHINANTQNGSRQGLKSTA
jgi:hypothetical protein